MKIRRKIGWLVFFMMACVLARGESGVRTYAENDLLARPNLRVTVGISDADIVGDDHRALQAAVDYVGNLGGGLVVIGPGEYVMRDSLHLRSGVTLRGAGALSLERCRT